MFFVLRGRVRVDAGLSGKTIERFNEIERFTHDRIIHGIRILGCWVRTVG